MVRSKKLKSILAIILTVGLFLVVIRICIIDIHDIMFALQRSVFLSSTESVLRNEDECRPVLLDPWDPEILPYLNPDYDPYKTCNVTREMYTELKNGTLRMTNESTSNCRYRCLYVKGEIDLKRGKWFNMVKNASYQVNCEFIEIHCLENNETTFRYIHDQLLRPKKKVFQNEDELHPGVFMLVFDSVSSSSGMRSIMETNEILRQLYDATTFYYHNEAGKGSRQNAYAIFSGTRLAKLDKRRFPEKCESEYPSSCKEGVKRNETITYDFIDQNYASMIAEDWVGAFNWPNCKGYDRTPTDHYCNALMLRSVAMCTITEEFEFDLYFYTGECQEPHHKVMNFVGKFLNEYKGISKFVMVWLSLLAHDTTDGLYHADKYFANFFRDHADNLKNSFIFLMADHGIGYGAARTTSIGEMESKNPMLTVALPKYLRSNEQLILNLKQNSRRHTSQYDIYATLYDIARLARKHNFQKWDEHDFSREFGERRGGIRAKSILRPISYDRTCGEMEIPEEYCICEQKWHKIDARSDDAMRAGHALIQYINDFLKEKNLTSVCDILDFEAVISAKRLETRPVLKIIASALPSNGKYEAQLLIEEDKFTVITRVFRVNRYGNQGHCTLDEEVRDICYCLQQSTTDAKQS